MLGTTFRPQLLPHAALSLRLVWKVFTPARILRQLLAMFEDCSCVQIATSLLILFGVFTRRIID